MLFIIIIINYYYRIFTCLYCGKNKYMKCRWNHIVVRLSSDSLPHPHPLSQGYVCMEMMAYYYLLILYYIFRVREKRIKYIIVSVHGMFCVFKTFKDNNFLLVIVHPSFSNFSSKLHISIEKNTLVMRKFTSTVVEILKSVRTECKI